MSMHKWNIKKWGTNSGKIYFLFLVVFSSSKFLYFPVVSLGSKLHRSIIIFVATCLYDVSIYFMILEFKPFGFGASAYVVFKQKESYQKDVLVSESRRRREAGTSSVFIRFRTTNNGLLFYAERGPRSSVLYVSKTHKID